MGHSCGRQWVRHWFENRLATVQAQWPMRADRLKILFWDDEEDQETVRGTVSPTNGLVMAYKRLEETTSTWPAIRDGVMTLNRAQFEALFAGLDWRRVKALEARRPAAAE
jgi:ssRNA-specific RNase YbeY (16S rRNA maturation enzyme)